MRGNPDAEQNPDSVWYVDADGDGYGDASISESGCEEPSGYVLNGDDCDDSDASMVGDVYYLDTDGDGYGDDDTRVPSCTELSGYSTAGDDCDDTDAAVHPGAAEVCGDGEDNDCNGDMDTTSVDDDGADLYEIEVEMSTICGTHKGPYYVSYFSDTCTSTQEIELESGAVLTVSTGCDMSSETGVTDVILDLEVGTNGVFSFWASFDIEPGYDSSGTPLASKTVTADDSSRHWLDNGWMCYGSMYSSGYEIWSSGQAWDDYIYGLIDQSWSLYPHPDDTFGGESFACSADFTIHLGPAE